MIRSSLAIALLIGSSIAPTLAIAANTEFYVAQDAKTHACIVTDKKPDGKMAMDVGTKAYDSQANAQKASRKQDQRCRFRRQLSCSPPLQVVDRRGPEIAMI